MASQWIDIADSGDRRFTGHLTLPPAGTGPGLVLLQEIWGVNHHIRAVAEQYALAGFVVLAPDVFWRQEHQVDLDYDEPGIARAKELRAGLDDARAGDDACQAARVLRERPEIQGPVAAVGYCLGGQLAYRAAAGQAVDAAVSFYGGGIAANLELAAQVQVPMLFHHAGRDKMIPPEDVDRIRRAFGGHDQAVFCDYPESDHGFSCWGRPAYDQRAAALAHGRSLTFLAGQL